ncbi:MAG: beta-ketoacyl-ACP synthase II [Candidatus Hydrogenedentes bacterium]|nr:beta-ketoacyl-ACP synthase II [Candidatus Hydrogenedentota bacterium]
MSTKVVVTGLGVVSPVGNDIDTFWKNICAGKSGIRAIDQFDTSDLTAKIAGIAEDVEIDGLDNKEMRRMSRYAQFAIFAAEQAWKQAGLDINKEDPYRCGTSVGSGIGGLNEINIDSVRMAEGGARRVSPLMVPKGLANMAAGAVAIHLGLLGPNKCVVTACASGTHSLGDAASLIQSGKADVMVAGGAEATVIPFGIAGFCAMKALSTRNDEPERASRPFDLDRNGFVMGEGAGIMVLESEEHAKARGAEILGVVAGMGDTCDAYHITAPRPDGSGVAAAMREALREAKLNPEDIGYFNAHGTSTKLNDAGECKALHVVFGEETPPTSSTKSMIGHLLGAAGGVEAVICILAMRDGILPPNINYDTPDPECQLNLVANTAMEKKVSAVMSNSLGFGGHNASIILTKYE